MICSSLYLLFFVSVFLLKEGFTKGLAGRAPSK